MTTMRFLEFKQVEGHDLAAEFEKIDPRVRTLVELAGLYSMSEFGLRAVVTSLLRSSVEQQRANPASAGSGPHRWGLAADLRVRHAPDPDAYGRRLVERLNAAVEYQGRPGCQVAILEGTGPQGSAGNSTGPHVHVQVPGPRTRASRLVATRLADSELFRPDGM